MFAVCGKRAVFEALISKRSYQYKTLMIAKGRERDEEVRQILHLANRRSISLEKVLPKDLDRYTPGFFNHQGLVLLLKEPPQETPIEALLDQAASLKKFRLLALDCISDHQNVGAIIRSAAAFGFSAVLTQEDRSAPLIHPSIWRISQGAVEYLDLVQVVNLSRALEELKSENFWVIGATTQSQNAQDVHLVKDWPEKLCLVLGSEERGLRRLTLEHCDIKISIPQSKPGHLDSLNVSHAGSIIFWEIFKQGIEESKK